ncbi:hypothetical protein EDB19DRAFT_1900540 [Suillus lakei]|nr:hypothetical protein EDB19DRAFT_1900540 [Suillus lakei]
MRFLSLYIVFISFSLALLLSGGVHGIPVSVSNPNASPRHGELPPTHHLHLQTSSDYFSTHIAEVHRRDDLLSAVVSLLESLLGTPKPSVSATQPVQGVIKNLQNLTASLPVPGLSALPVPRGAVEAVGVGSSYSSTVQASSSASPSQASASPSQAPSAAASVSAAHQQADVHPGRGRHIHRRDTTSASAPSSSVSAHASSTSASGSVRASSVSASGKPALAVVPSLSVSLPIPTPSFPVSPPVSSPSPPVSLPIPTPLPASIPVSILTHAASGMPKASGTTKGKRTHHR